MKQMFKKIHRYKEQDFEEGKPFEFTFDVKRKEDNTDLLCPTVNKMQVGKSYKITVKKYMTEPATANFDFQDKWNDRKPMPLCIMQGDVIKETRGMYYMNLQGKSERTSRCLVCGKTLTNPISKLYGIDTKYNKKVGLIRIESEDDAKEKLEHIMTQIDDITWAGWVIKSAIKEREEI